MADQSLPAAKRLTSPGLMLHGDNGFLPAAARRHMAVVPSGTRTLVIKVKPALTGS